MTAKRGARRADIRRVDKSEKRRRRKEEEPLGYPSPRVKASTHQTPSHPIPHRNYITTTLASKQYAKVYTARNAAAI